MLLVRFSWRQIRRGTYVWAGIVYVLVVATAQGYQNLYPDAASRRVFATTVASSSGFSALLGTPRRLETTGGFLVWRTGTTLTVMLGVWALLTTTRLLRGEEDAGRWQTLGTGPRSPVALTRVVMITVALATLVPLAAGIAGALTVIATAHLAFADSVWFMVAVASSTLAFAAVAAVTSQLFAPRSRATLASGVLLAVAYLLRIVADGEPRLRWMRWATPLGWFEQVHVFAGTRLAVLLLFFVWIVACCALALSLAGRRDLEAAVVSGSESTRQVRASQWLFVRSTVIGWTAGATVTAFVLGALAPSAARAIRDSGLAEKFGGLLDTRITTTAGYLGAMFAIVVAALVAMSPSGHVTSARNEEETGRLETFLAGLPSRRRWLWTRIVLALAGAAVMAVGAGVFGWIGQRVAGGDVGFVHLLAATLAYVPVAMAFGGVGIAVFGVAPRLTHGLVSTLVGVTLLIVIVGSIIKAPSWVLDLSPFFHLGSAPSEPVRAAPALLLALSGALFAVFGVEWFARRDLAGE
jgi:ABC-2 type transport system permease protein